jgi:hypothetical protein
MPTQSSAIALARRTIGEIKLRSIEACMPRPRWRSGAAEE